MAKRLAAGIALTALLAGNAQGLEKKVDPADSYYKAAVESVHKGSYNEALVYFAQVLEYGPQTDHFREALDWVESGVFNNAKDHYMKLQQGNLAAATIWTQKAEQAQDAQLKIDYKEKALHLLEENKKIQEEVDSLIRYQNTIVERQKATK
jgi:outer membrane protein assembly factor BamD (BamD/ComL family)